MGSLIKVWITLKDGRKVKSKHWYGQWIDENGRRRRKSLAQEKQVAREGLRKIEKAVERRKEGFIDCFTDAVKRPLEEHLSDFERHLKGNGRTQKHVQGSLAKIRAIVAGCQVKGIAEFDATNISDWLATKRNTEKRFSIATSNNHVRAIKGFSRWLVKQRRLPADPLAGLATLNAKIDLRHVRRALSTEEVAQLLEATRQSERIEMKSGSHLTGLDRYMLYLTAMRTGFRANELASLTPKSFDWEAGILTLGAEFSKHRTRDDVPILEPLPQILKPYVENRPKSERIFSGNWWKEGAEILRRDLVESGIEYEVDGEVYDFHALRGQLATDGSRANVPPKVLQEMMRHSTIDLTMNYYTKLKVNDLSIGMSNLPSPIQSEASQPKKSAG